MKVPKYSENVLCDDGILVNKQVSVPIVIGNYSENVLCDITLLDIGHIILGRPWQFDHQTLHEDRTSKMIFFFQGSKFFCVSSHNLADGRR